MHDGVVSNLAELTFSDHLFHSVVLRVFCCQTAWSPAWALQLQGNDAMR
jgi:hypothetical protein